MAGNNNDLCSVCLRKVSSNARKLKCDTCSHHIHKNCTNLYKKDLDEIINEDRNWSCLDCNETNFPFNNISDDDLFYASLKNNGTAGEIIVNNSLDKLFIPFEINDNDYIYQDVDSDPDIHFYNQNQLISNLNSKYYLEKEFSKYISPTLGKENECMSFIHLNIRSAKANLKSFEAYLESLDYSFDCIGLSETWFNESNSDSYNITGYNKIDKKRISSQGGGVSLLLKEDIKFKERTDLCIVNNDVECIFVEALLTKKVLIGVIYRPPNRKINDFNENLKSILDQIDLALLPCYLMGDTNINVINHVIHKETDDYLDLVYSKGLIPVINRPTRVTDHSATLIDHIFTSHYTASNFYQGILVTDITDHYPIFHVAHFEKLSKDVDEYYYKRSMSSDNYASFYNDISQVNWNEVTNSQNCQMSFSLFYEKIKFYFNKSFPLKRVKKGYKNKLPWLTDGLKNSIKFKNKLYVKSLKHDTVLNKIQYKEFKLSLKKLMTQREKDYFNEMIENNKSNMKKTWDIIKCVIGKKKQSLKYSEFIVNGQITNDRNVIANKFNEYFANIGPNLSKDIPESCTSFKKYLKHNYIETFFVKNIESDEIRKIIMSLKDGAPGIDSIPAAVLKHSVDLISLPLSHVCQLSLTEGYFPSELKLSKIIPLYKAKDPSVFNNYRPISLLSVFFKNTGTNHV